MSSEYDPIGAVTAANPYPYYASLVSERPFFRDERLAMWVAASAEAVEAVLSCPVMRVRPIGQPVPGSIAGTGVGEIFGRLVRMTDGPSHVALKGAVGTALDGTDWNELAATNDRCARLLSKALAIDDPAAIASYAFEYPALVTAATLGLPLERAMRATSWTREFVHAIFPASGPGEIARGISATVALRAALAEEVEPQSLCARLLRDARKNGIGDDVAIANAIGFLLQGYEATAGLIGNTLVALARRPESLRRSLAGEMELLHAFVTDVVRDDAPVQNTRRFADREVTLMGSQIARGDAVLVVVAAANRDPRATRTYTFGLGAHACPGMRMATTIAAAGVAGLLAAGVDVAALSVTGYLPRENVRIPDFVRS